ncbi:MAG: DUF305 domain-containing protein [Actinoplanes sp.]
MSRSTRLTLVVVLGGALFLTGCTADDPPSRTAAPAASSASAAPPVRVVVPGRPGESARVTDSNEVPGPDGSTFSTIDVTFVQMMIVHHAQAVEMADLAPQRAGSATLRALAARISAAQKPEMAYLRGWLSQRQQSENAGHDHSTMPGMQSAADMAALAAARGSDFDRRFVTMMVAHHKGAIQMAGDVVQGGSDEQLREMAGEMSIEQGSEINRLQALAP